MTASPVPVALFAWRRTELLAETLSCLRRDGVQLVYAFSDGPRTPEQAPEVERVRELLRSVDWADLRLKERRENLGLGESIRAGVSEVLAEHEMVVVFEDDLVTAPGTFGYLCAALQRYRDEPRVLSVTAWTHPSTTPRRVTGPYFDGRAECLLWGSWRRAWVGMERSALSWMEVARQHGNDPRRYGDDLVEMAREEARRNIWAVRWSFLHIANRGLCLRPPRSLVEHQGLDAAASNSARAHRWANPTLGPVPVSPIAWPAPAEHPDCPRLWRKACGGPARKVRMHLTRLATALGLRR